METFHVIDDEANITSLLESMIDCFGFGSLTFPSADAYLEYFNSPSYEPPVAILTDNVMPGTSGYQLIEIVRRSIPDQRFVMISGTPDGQRIEDSNLCFTLHKPFRMDELKRLLDILVACDKEAEPGDYTPMCKFGLNHQCPRSAEK